MTTRTDSISSGTLKSPHNSTTALASSEVQPLDSSGIAAARRPAKMSLRGTDKSDLRDIVG
jgi:hypothetical protein